jgi:hypothetical protein
VKCIIELVFEQEVGAISALVMLTHVGLLLVAIGCEVQFPFQHVKGQGGLEESMRFNDVLLTGTCTVT